MGGWGWIGRWESMVGLWVDVWTLECIDGWGMGPVGSSSLPKEASTSLY